MNGVRAVLVALAALIMILIRLAVFFVGTWYLGKFGCRATSDYDFSGWLCGHNFAFGLVLTAVVVAPIAFWPIRWHRLFQV